MKIANKAVESAVAARILAELKHVGGESKFSEVRSIVLSISIRKI
jgi:hypothetical protein